MQRRALGPEPGTCSQVAVHTKRSSLFACPTYGKGSFAPPPPFPALTPRSRPQYDDEEIVFKCQLGAVTKVVHVPVESTFDELGLLLASKFAGQNVDKIQYKEGDGSMVDIEDDDDVEGAIAYAQEEGNDRLHVFLNHGTVAPQGTVVDAGLFGGTPAAAATVVDMSLFGAPGGGGTAMDAGLFGGGPPAGGAPAMPQPSRARKIDSGVLGSCAVEWELGKRLGMGTSGTVYEAKNLSQPSQPLAVKQFNLKEAGMSRREIEMVEEEIKLMDSLTHANIVDYIGTQRRDGNLYILMELVDGGSLESTVEKQGPMSEADCAKTVKQVIAGLAYLHSKGIIHRDIKAGNILVSKSGTFKLSDFGCSRKLMDQKTAAGGCQTKVGTPVFMAPEIISGGGYGRKSDIWSLGCLVIELATGKPPWQDLASRDMIRMMHEIATSNRIPALPESFSAKATDFITKCFQRDPQQRATVDELAAHAFVQ